MSRGAGALGAVLKGMLPQYERRGSDLLKTVAAGSAAALEETSVVPGLRPGLDGAEPRPHTNNSPAQSPDDLTGVQQRLAAMPPIILGHHMAHEIGATAGAVVLVTSPQCERSPFC